MYTRKGLIYIFYSCILRKCLLCFRGQFCLKLELLQQKKKKKTILPLKGDPQPARRYKLGWPTVANIYKVVTNRNSGVFQIYIYFLSKTRVPWIFTWCVLLQRSLRTKFLWYVMLGDINLSAWRLVDLWSLVLKPIRSSDRRRELQHGHNSEFHLVFIVTFLEVSLKRILQLSVLDHNLFYGP